MNFDKKKVVKKKHHIFFMCSLQFIDFYTYCKILGGNFMSLFTKFYGDNESSQ